MPETRRKGRRLGGWVALVGGLMVAGSVLWPGYPDYLGLFLGAHLVLYIAGTALLLVGGFFVGRRFFGRLLLLVGVFNGIIAGVDSGFQNHVWAYYLSACAAGIVSGLLVLYWNARVERQDEERAR